MSKIVTRFLLLAICALGWAESRQAFGTITLQSPNPTIHDRFQNNAGFIGNPYDWSGVGRGTSGRWATAVSPSFVLSAKHYPPGGTVRFYHTNNPSGASEDRTIIHSSSLANGDMWVGQLSAPLSSNVSIYPILDLPNFSDYDNREIFTYGLNVHELSQSDTSVRLGRNVIVPGTAGFYSDLDSGPPVVPGAVYLFNYDSPGLGADESRVEAGDSGGPSFHIFGGQPALVGIHWFQTTGPLGSGDSLVPYYISAIQNYMISRGSSETLTLVPEPGTLLLAGMAAAAVGRVARKRRGNRPRAEKIRQ